MLNKQVKLTTVIAIVVAAVTLTILVVLPLGGQVSAAELNAITSDRKGGPRLMGTIESLDANALTLDTGRGEVVVGLTADTRFLNPDREEISINDLEVGRWVAVSIGRGEGDAIVARAVVLFPADFVPQDHKPFKVIGEITVLDVGEGSISIMTVVNETFDLTVGARTRYRNRANQAEIDFSDLEVGRYIYAETHRNLDDQFVTGLVVLLPEDFDPTEIENAGFGGEVIAVDETAGTFTLHTRAEIDLVVSVDANTIWEGDVSGLSGMTVGMQARGKAQRLDDGSLLALNVWAGEAREGQFNCGKVTSIDTTADTFTIHTRLNQGLTFAIDADTRFESRSGQVTGLDDLEIGMGVNVTAIVQDDESLLAVKVQAGWPQQRAVGHVTAVSGNILTLETRGGETLILQVTENTHFGGWDGQVTELADLEEGMLVIVSYQDQGDNGLIALAVLSPRIPED